MTTSRSVRTLVQIVVVVVALFNVFKRPKVA